MNVLKPFTVDFSGVHLIEASAGTGKTYNISSLYIRALIESDRNVDEILVVTYTEAATKELRDRLMKRLRESIHVLEGGSAEDDSFLHALQENVSNKAQAINRLKAAIHSFDEASVFTIHGFCRHALQERAFNSGAPFEAELIGDDSEIVGEIVDDYWRRWVREASDSPLKRPLLKFLLDKGYTPDKLTSELGAYTGKPYLDVKPDDISTEGQDEKLFKLGETFEKLKNLWNQNQGEIFQLLDSGHLSYYRTDWLNGWMAEMEEWLQSQVAPIDYFDKFSRFSQSHINQSLKKKSAKKGFSPPKHDFFKQVDAYIDLVEDLQNFDVIFKRRLLDHIRNELPAKKEELQVFSFDDLLTQLCNALQYADRGETLRQDLRKAYPIALVDEFQDTDPIQYRIFKSIYEGHDAAALFMIGDPKQSIYSFRGADIFSYLRAKDDAPDQKMFSLGHNYRSIPPLINGVNAIFEAHDNPFILENIPFNPVKPGRESIDRLKINGSNAAPLEFRQLTFEGDDGEINKGEAKDRSAADTAAQIKKLLAEASKGNALIGDRAVEANDIAVLVRSHRQAELVTKALRDVGVKSVKHSRESVFQSEEAKELYLVLQAIADPGNERLITTAMSGRMLGYTANEILALKENEASWADKLQRFSALHEMWQEQGFAFMFRKLMQDENIAETVIALQDGERKLTNLIHLSELIIKQEKERQAGMHTTLKWLLKKRNEENKDAEDEQLRLESDENLVRVVTMHHSKGLEYSIVFCPFLWDAPQHSDHGAPLVYHHPDDKSKVYLDLHGKNDPDRSQKRYWQAKEDLAESVRLAYVAITRAKYKCVINWVNAKNNAHSALGFLLLGSDEAFASLLASVDSDKKYEKNNLSGYTAAFKTLSEYDSIASPLVTTIEQDAGAIQSEEEAATLEVNHFNRPVPLPRGPGMASFSSLIRNEQEDFDTDFRAYYDEPFDHEESWKRPGAATIFDFPKGPNPGTAIHHIFENIAFDDPDGWNAEIKEQLLTQNIDERWVPVVKRMLEITLKKPLIENQQQFTLANLTAGEMIEELEFYFTTGSIRLRKILEIIRPEVSVPVSLEGFAEDGFLKGFIDLTFRYNGRYYILDYKTNYLGDSVECYDADELKDEIREALYDVQYHLYSVALHRFLNNRLNNYSYEKDVGGSFYLFLRGMNEKGREGIFFHRPETSVINKLDTYLKQQS